MQTSIYLYQLIIYELCTLKTWIKQSADLPTYKDFKWYLRDCLQQNYQLNCSKANSLNNARKKTGVSYFRYKQRTSRTSCILDSHADVFIGNILARVNLLLRHRFYTHVNMLLYDAHIMKKHYAVWNKRKQASTSTVTTHL